MSRVFIPQLPSIKGRTQDVTDASRFGELVVVFHPEDPKYKHASFADNADERMPEMLAHAKAVLADFNFSTDRLALSGAPLYIAMCMWALAPRNVKLNLLRYDRVERGYYSVTFTDVSQ